MHNSKAQTAVIPAEAGVGAKRRQPKAISILCKTLEVLAFAGMTIEMELCNGLELLLHLFHIIKVQRFRADNLIGFMPFSCN